MKKTAFFLVAVMIVSLVLASCGNNTNEIAGVWKEIEGDGILYFAEDNVGLSQNVTYTSESFEYEKEGTKLTFIAESTVETEHSVNKSILTITVDGDEYVYEAVKLSEGEVEGYLADCGIDIKVLPEIKGTDKVTDTESDTEKPDEPNKDDGSDKKPTDEEIAESVVGAWRYGDDTLTMVYFFYEDGTGIAGGLFPFTYSVKDGVITMTIEAFGQVETGSARYEIDGDALYIDTDDGVKVATRTDIELPETTN